VRGSIRNYKENLGKEGGFQWEGRIRTRSGPGEFGRQLDKHFGGGVERRNIKAGEGERGQGATREAKTGVTGGSERSQRCRRGRGEMVLDATRGDWRRMPGQTGKNGGKNCARGGKGSLGARA